MEKKKPFMDLKLFNRVFTWPFFAALTGFGGFWFYRLSHMNVFVSIFIGMWLSAVISPFFIVEDSSKKNVKK